MFLGKNALTVDLKGRTQFPAKYRDDLALLCNKQVMIVACEVKGCLEVYPLPVWEARLAIIDALPESAADEKTSFYSNSEAAEIDASGRLALTPMQRAAGDVQPGPALLKAAGTFFEIWNIEREAAYAAAQKLRAKSSAYESMPAAYSATQLRQKLDALKLQA